MVSALLMIRRLARTLRHAVRDGEFLPVLSAGIVLVALGTLAYLIGEGWGLIDAVYFSVSTLTTTSPADPSLILTSAWLKLFTVAYELLGIGVLVELLRRLGSSYVATQADDVDADQPAPAA